MLRPYQQEAVAPIMAWINKCVDPCLLEAATGSGKSHIVAAIAEHVVSGTGKKVLCLAPSKELTEQNYSKYMGTGNPASYYSSALGKSMVHDVIFGTPGTVNNSIKKFGKEFAVVVIDEAHGLTPTVHNIISEIQKQNPMLRVIGMTATPYRLGSGYIFKWWPNGTLNEDDTAKDPYFHTLVHQIPARKLIDEGYLTEPVIIDHEEESYDTAGLKIKSMGKFNAKEVEQTFVGKGRLTSKIIEEIVFMAAARCGVIIFASTVSHAYEILESLPQGNSAVVHGASKDRDAVIKAFKSRQIKYIVNVQVLTTGFDAPHIDMVVFMRATESVGLMQQMIGRGLRIDEGKQDCLIVDYAGNVERHCPDGDLFKPVITAHKKSHEAAFIKAVCGTCNFENSFSARINKEGFDVNEEGYFVDLAGNELEIPAHHGRRCNGESLVGGTFIRCNGRWTSKECPDCHADNDIAARHCNACKCEIIDPNEKLKLEYDRIKLSPSELSTDKVITWRIQKWKEKSIRIDFTTKYRTFPVWFFPWKRVDWNMMCRAVGVQNCHNINDFMVRAKTMPASISAKKDGDYYKVYFFNEEVDKDPSE